jgi:hypothetical protein
VRAPRYEAQPISENRVSTVKLQVKMSKGGHGLDTNIQMIASPRIAGERKGAAAPDLVRHRSCTFTHLPAGDRG